MTKLLSANFFRLRKNKFFWISNLFMFAIGIFMPAINYIANKNTVHGMRLDNNFFICVVFIEFILAVLCSLFIGTEYSDGTIRNKIITGQNRVAIYLANLITCTASGIIMCVVYFITFLCVGIPLIGFFETKIKIILMFVLGVFMIAISFTAIFTLVAMLNQNKTITAIICILGTVMLLMLGVYTSASLAQPKMTSGYTVSAPVDGKDINDVPELEFISEPNPKYLDGTKRKVYQFINDFLPGGQVAQMCLSFSIPWYLPLYSGIIAVLTTGLGVFIFKKKDLR